MASRKRAGRGSGASRQGSAGGSRQGSGNSRQGAGTARQRSGNSPQRSAGSVQPGTSGRPGQARQNAPAGKNGAAGGTTKSARTGAAPASAATAVRGTGRPSGNGSASATAVVGAEATAARSPAGRLLHAVWSPFRTMGGLPLATFIVSLYGLGASIYLTIAHYDTHITLACSDKGFVNCEQVTTSAQSMLFHVFPVAVLGLAFYIFMAAVNSPWGWRLEQPAVRWARTGSVVVGMAFVLYLIYAELIEIRAICLWCTSVHVATFLIFALIVFHTTFSWGRPVTTARR